MLDYMLMPLRRYAQFHGRARRKEFLWFTMFNMIVFTIIIAIMFGMGLTTATLADAGNNPAAFVSAFFFSGWGVLLVIFWLAVLIPTIAVTIRRLHDRDMSGWWYPAFFLASLLPYVGFLASIAWFVVLLLPGTVGPNRFGADPKAPDGADVFG